MKASHLFIIFILLLVLGAVAAIWGYAETIYKMDRAIALLSRAETAGFAEEFIVYVEAARALLPKEGNPVWIFPTSSTDFTLIQQDVESILGRARILTSLPKNSDGYQQGMDDLRGKVRVLQAQIGQAAPFMYASPLNLALAALWLLAQGALIRGMLKLVKPPRREIEVEEPQP